MIEKKIYYINPVFEAKYWGGQALKRDTVTSRICLTSQSFIT